MGKVICINTKKEIKQRQFSKEEGESVLRELFLIDQKHHIMVDILIEMVENMSGASAIDTIDAIYEEREGRG